MSNIVTEQEKKMLAVESALLRNDISKLTTAEKQSYYNSLCESVGLNPLTKPFAFLTLSGREVLYATKDCSEQLRKIHGVSIQILSHAIYDGLLEVSVKARDKTGREDEDFAAIPVNNAKGEQLANLKMKAVTKAKRRVTLSICGLGVLDESELDTIHADDKGFAENPQIKNVFEREQAPTALQEPEQVQQAEQVVESENPADYVIKFGKKFNGKKMSEISNDDHQSMIKWLVRESEKSPISADASVYIEKATQYLSAEPKLDTEEKLPF